MQALEVRVASSGVMQKRAETLVNPPADVVLKHRLKWTVKSALYRIVVRFQRHITYVDPYRRSQTISSTGAAASLSETHSFVGVARHLRT